MAVRAIVLQHLHAESSSNLSMSTRSGGTLLIFRGSAFRAPAISTRLPFALGSGVSYLLWPWCLAGLIRGRPPRSSPGAHSLHAPQVRVRFNAGDANIRVDLPEARGDRGANPPDIDPPIIPRRLRLTREMFERFGVDRYTSHVIFLMQFAQFISCTSHCMAQVSVRARHSISCHP